MKNWLKNPLAGHIIGISGIVIGTFLWAISRQYPELSYSINPIRSSIVKSGTTSKLKTYYGDREIRGDLNIAQIAIWNNGNAPIKISDTLSTIQLETVPISPILEVTVNQLSRSEIKFAFNDSLFSQGKVPINWIILEQNDGALLQVIYEGNEHVDFQLVGSIIKQRSLKKVFKERSEKKLWSLIIGIIFILGTFGWWETTKSFKYRLLIFPSRILHLAFIFYFIYIWIKFFLTSPTIPFNF
jgi:hypothetical protein